MSSKPPDLVFFIDRSLGKHKIPQALRALGHSVVIHDEVFEPETPDEVWLSEAGRSGWIVLTKDEHIRYRKNELAAARRTGVRLFVLTAGNLTGDEMATVIASALPRVKRLATRIPGPCVASIDRRGRVTLLIR